MYDIGVNLSHPSYLESLEQFQKDYHEQGVNGIICIASNLDESLANLKLCAPYSDMFVTLGCHPHHASSWKSTDTDTLIDLFHHYELAVAVGETGLDFNRNYSTPDEQIKAFQAQLNVAATVRKPIYLHERDAFDTMIEMLSSANLDNSGVIHCFTGDSDAMKCYLDFNLYVGITGWLLDERRNQSLKEAVKQLPLERLLIETDSPYLLPRNIRPRPKRNHPKYLPWIAQEIARIKELPVEDVISAADNNTKTLFFSRDA